MIKKYLRRYTDIPALIYLLRERKITLLDPQSWDDHNDSHYLAVYQQKAKLRSVLALCFSQTGETYHHWRVFANGSSGVCIRFKRAGLSKAAKKIPGLRMGPVRYLKIDEIRNSKVGIKDLPFLKRYPFEHEEEFRMIYESKNAEVPSLDVDIPLSCVDRIYLSPWIHPSISRHVRQVLKSVDGCRTLPIVRSTLISNDEWKTLGDRAS